MKSSIIYAILYLALLFLGSCSKSEIEKEDSLYLPDKLILYAVDPASEVSDYSKKK